MKNLLIFVFFLFPGLANAVDANTKFTWSARAFSEVMKDMRTQCETTDAGMFIDIGNWAFDNRFYLSYNDLKDKCLSVAKFRGVERGKQGKPCKMPLPCYDENTCSERSVINTGVVGCDIYISSLQKIHNEYADIQKYGKPGTYVVEGEDENVLRVVDVILPKNYLKSDGSINEKANKYSANCIIWKVQKMPDGRFSIIDTGLKTWTADMFFDVQNVLGSGDKGGVRGVMAEPIFLNRDVTHMMYQKFDKEMGEDGAFVDRAKKSFDGKEYDVKNNSDFGASSESFDDGHGVMFGGKVANYDWLGHFLFGMFREDTILPDKLANAAAHALQAVPATVKDATANLAIVNKVDSYGDKEKVGAGIVIKAVHDSVNTLENKKIQFAWDMGSELVRSWHNNTDKTTFVDFDLSDDLVDIGAKRVPQAFAIAKCKFVKDYPGLSLEAVDCIGFCDKSIDDVVVCRGKSGDRYLRKQYVFDDICDSGDTSDTYQQLYQRYCK